MAEALPESHDSQESEEDEEPGQEEDCENDEDSEDDVASDTRSTSVTRMNVEPRVQHRIKTDLRPVVTKAWVAFANNVHLSRKMWLSACRVGIYGLYLVSMRSDTIWTFIEDSLDRSFIAVPVLNLLLKIAHQYSFKLSLVYGYLNSIIYQRDLCTDRRKRLIYRRIIAGCKLQSRHNNMYFSLLLLFAEKFPDTFDAADLDDMFELVNYNVSRTEYGPLVRCIVRHENFGRTNEVFNDLLAVVSWNTEYKYLLLAEILAVHPKLLSMIYQVELVAAIMYSQEKPHLCEAGGRLYQVVVRYTAYEDWLDGFYPAIKTILANNGLTTQTTQQRNITKYCLLNSFRRYPDLATTLLDDLNGYWDLPIYSVLSIALIGLQHNFFGPTFDFREYALMGLNHFDARVRNYSFSIFCHTAPIAEHTTTLKYLEAYLAESINSADESTRDSIRDSVSAFLKLVYCFIATAEDDDAVAVNTIQTVFNSILASLLQNMKVESNHERFTTSMMLIDVFSIYFQRYPDNKCGIEEQKKLQKFSDGLILYESHIHCYSSVVNMVICSKQDQCSQVMNLIFNNLIDLTVDKIPNIDYFKLGMLNLNSHNFGLADIGMKQIRFQLRLLREQGKHDDVNEHLQIIYDMMLEQWDNIKVSRFQSIVYQKNPLHSSILLVNYTLYLFDKNEFEKLFSFCEDINRYLLRAFESRFCSTYKSRYCCGVAQAMQNPHSDYNRGTINSMWLVLRNSCRLAFTMLQLEKNACLMQRCLNIIYETMERCNHKGVLQDAANILGELVRFCTSDNTGLDVLDPFVEQYLHRLHKLRISTSLVRLSIETQTFLYTVAINDNRFGKPLLHTIMTYLRRELSICVRLPVSYQTDVSLMKLTVLLNCVEPIINDDSVEEHVTEYLCEILICCLQSSEHQWHVRDAAMRTIAACSNRLLGHKVSLDDQCERRPVCLEELFYKQPNLYTFVTHHFRMYSINNHTRLNTITPIIALLGSSYMRCGIRGVIIEKNMTTLENRVKNYALNVQMRDQFYSAARAYIAVCPHGKIERAIKSFTPTIDNNGDLAENCRWSIYIIESMYRHLIDNMRAIPNCVELVNGCSERLKEVLAVIGGANNYNYIILSRVMFVNYKVLPVDLRELEYNITYICRNRDIANEFPGVWGWICETVRHVLKRIQLIDMKALVTLAFTEAAPMQFKRMIVSFIKKRVEMCCLDRTFVANELSDTLVRYIFEPTNVRMKHILDECIEMLVELTELTLSDDVVRDGCFATLTQFQNGAMPLCYMPIYCLIVTQYCSEDEVAEMELIYFDFVLICTAKLIKDNYEPMLYKSIIFIAYFARKHGKHSLLTAVLRLCYDMLQRGNPRLDVEVSKVLRILFNTEKTHAFANIIAILNTKNLVPLIGVKYTARFLVQIYVCRERSAHMPAECSFYQQKNLYISTDVILDKLIYCVHTLFSAITPEEFTEIKQWFRDFAINVHNEFVENLTSYLNSDPLNCLSLF